MSKKSSNFKNRLIHADLTIEPGRPDDERRPINVDSLVKELRQTTSGDLRGGHGRPRGGRRP